MLQQESVGVKDYKSAVYCMHQRVRRSVEYSGFYKGKRDGWFENRSVYRRLPCCGLLNVWADFGYR